MSDAEAVLALERRLAEAESTIKALLTGQIDAVVDPATHNPVLLFKAQHELKKSEERYRRERDRAQRFLEAAEVILLAADVNGNITLINRYGAELLGWTAEDLIGRSWVETCIPPRLHAHVRARYVAVLAGDTSIGETAVLLRSGEERIIKWRNRVLTDEDGNVTGAFTCGTDITDEKRANELLRAAEERMRFALEAGGLGIWDMDFKTGELQWSQILEGHYGILPGQFGGTLDAFIASVHPDDREELSVSVAEAMRSGADFKLAHRSLAPDGTVRWLEGAGRTQLDVNGEPARGIGVSHDVTERRILSTHYQRAHKMEAIGQLASGVAHDFNNLLTVILGFADLLASDFPPASEHGADVAEIIKAAQRASGLTKQLLAFSRQQVMSVAHVDVNLLISDLSVMLERLIGENVEIVLKLSPDLPPALVDAGQLEQVVMNLVVNARDAMPHGGVVVIETLTAAQTPSGAEKTIGDAGYVLMCVTDSGQGMTKETERRLFEPFFTTKPPGKGTGLGLSTTYGIVKQSKGFIELDTQIGKGTTFKVYLPTIPHASHTPAASVASPPSEAVATETILLVEDEGGVRQLAKRILENAGYRVFEAQNGSEGQEAFKEYGHSVDLVVTDMIMPVCGGAEMVRRLREWDPRLRVLFISGYTEHSMEEQAAKESGAPFVQKPFTAAELLQSVREALSQE